MCDMRIEGSQNDRFVRLRKYLSSVNFRNLDIIGVNKFAKSEIRYELAHVSPPDSVYFWGEDWRVLNSHLSVSFGGTVSPTADAYQMSIILAQSTVQNASNLDAIVVSGGVLGVDMAAHLGALDQNGKTIAVVANPVKLGLHPYKPKRSFLETGILGRGGIVSEYAEAAGDFRQRLLDRGRIITALSNFFVAIECSRDSATVDTAKRAKIQGKRALAIDWGRLTQKWGSPNTTGLQQLMSEGIAEPFPLERVSGSKDSWWWDAEMQVREQFRDVLRSG